jgi:NADPH:quinone reductase-like Zn-dependent oxidoreductase
MVGGVTFEPSLKCLSEYGQMACISSPGQPRVEFSLLEFYRKNQSLYGLNTVLDGVSASAVKLKRLIQEFEADAGALSCLGETQVVSFLDARNVAELTLAKKLRKPVFKMNVD